VAYMRHVGYTRARNLVGGIAEWTDKVDPSLPRY
jgi:rhodanese-related sulfurtransferase